MPFLMKNYQQADDREQYVCNLISSTIAKKTLGAEELKEIVNNVDIPLTTRQSNQLYFYAICKDNNQGKEKNNKNIGITQVRNAIDVRAVGQWINSKIKNKEIRFRQRINSVNIGHKVNNSSKLPTIIPSSSEKLKQELKDLIEIFEQMEKERQNSGLIPINQNDDNEVQVPFLNIPYDSQLAALNNSLCQLRIKAEGRLLHIIELARNNHRIKKKLEEAIEKFQEERIKANQKVGRMGAIRAMERLAKRKRDKEQRIRDLDLGEKEDIVRAARLHALLSLPQVKGNRSMY